ncbi:PAS domain-containing protein [Sandaracinus amylolyticus]|uniref:hybrid sensor histidine kinase/response regulator n=1 Tax=Sandaracinus amylolyticus TaxID=927083 RepID=UPI001F219391|nr:PAS domain-containing protein [Sandaracinus amylolyticus]UJR85788.1 Hypothetical protein I5071_78680 [Sandaracinus amylolyticus]
MSQHSEPGGKGALDARPLASIVSDLQDAGGGDLDREDLQAALAQAPVGIAIWRGPEHVYRFVNRRYAEMFAPRALVGRTLRDAFPELDEDAHALWNRVYATGEPFVAYEHRGDYDRRGTGVREEAYFTFSLHPVRRASGEVDGVVAIATEVTEAVKVARASASQDHAQLEGLAETAAALRRSEEQLRVIINTVPALVAYVDRDLVYRWCNESYEHWFGPVARTYVGRRMQDVVGERAHEIVRPRLDAVLRGERVAFEDEIPYAHGGKRWVDATYAPVLGPGGDVEGFVALVHDVSDRRRAERALDLLARASVELGASLDIDVVLSDLTRVLVPDVGEWCAVYLRGEDGRTTLAALTHRSAEKAALIREEVARFPRPDDAELGDAAVIRTGRAEMYSRIEPAMLERFATSPEHERLLQQIAPRSVMIVPLRAQGRVLGALSVGRSESGVAYDAADLALAEELGRRAAAALENARLFALAQTERVRAEEANRAKDEFLAMVSHELRTPLNAMLGWSRLLETGGLDEAKRARAVEVIARNARAQAQLIDDLLDVTRVVSGKIRLEVVRVDLTRVIDAALESMRPAADAKQLTVEVQRDPAASEMLGDADRLQQVVFNLLSNAVKFTPPGGTVRVRSERIEHALRITVTDSGEGIDASFLPYVFERFRQAEVGTTRSKGGLGLGLAIVRSLVELHGGTIHAHSAGRGHGATFTVVLPIAPERTEPRRGSPSSPSMPAMAPPACTPTLHGVRVLVVDDERDARELLRTVLEGCGAEVTTSASVSEALARLDARVPDVIVSDIGMPGEDGYALIDRVRRRAVEDGGRVPAVALTAFARTEDRTRALRAGFDVHVAKPFDPTELLLVVANAAARAKSS